MGKLANNLVFGKVTFQVTAEHWSGTIQKAFEKKEVEFERKTCGKMHI